MLKAECIRDTAKVHGVAWTAEWAKKKGLNIDTVMFALFGKYSH